MVRHDKADIMFTSHILHAVREGTPLVRIPREGTCACVRFLVCSSWNANVEADVQFENWDWDTSLPCSRRKNVLMENSFKDEFEENFGKD